MSDQQSNPQGRGHQSGPWTFGRPWAPNPGYWGPPEPWRMPYYGPYCPTWGAPPMAPPPQVQYEQQGNQAFGANGGKQKTPAPSELMRLEEFLRTKKSLNFDFWLNFTD
jgi:hypothetical protein